MERKDIEFGVEKVDHQWYFHFDKNTGTVNSMSINKQDSSIAIPDELAQSINDGADNMLFYKVIFENGKYTYVNAVQVPTENVSTVQSEQVENANFYKIDHSNAEAKIVFEHQMNEITISATQPMKDIIKETFEQNHVHRFFICKRNDHSIFYKMLEVNLLDLCKKQITMPMEFTKGSYSIYCRKMLEYSYV